MEENTNIIIEKVNNHKPWVTFKKEMVVQGFKEIYKFSEETSNNTIQQYGIIPLNCGGDCYIELIDLYRMVVYKYDSVEKYYLSTIFRLLCSMGVVKPLAILLAKFAIKEYKAEVLED